jgi:hypothetical protein
VFAALNIMFTSIWMFLFTQLLSVPVLTFIIFVYWRHVNEMNQKRLDYKKLQNFQRKIQGKGPHWWPW